MELHMVNIIYAGLLIPAQTEKMTFHAKTTSAKLYLYNGLGARDLYIDEAHTALDIFRFAAFLCHDQTWARSHTNSPST